MAVLTGVTPSRDRGRFAILAHTGVRFLLGFAVGLLLVAGGLLAWRQTYTDRIVPGVRVAGLEVGGMTRAAAARALTGELGGLEVGRIVVRSSMGATTLSYADVGRRADLDRMLDDAAAIGRGGTPVDEAISTLRLCFRPVDVGLVVRLDRSRLDAALAAFADRMALPAVDASVLAAPTYAVVPSVDGARPDVRGAADRIEAAALRPDAGPEIALSIGTVTVPAAGRDADAARAGEAARRVARDLVVADGSTRWTIKGGQIAGWVSVMRSPTGYLVAVDAAAIRPALEGIRKAITRAPTDASYLVDRSGDIVGVRASKDGRTLDVAATAERIYAALLRRADAPDAEASVAAATLAVQPALTTAEATRIAPLMVRLGRWTTYYVVSAHNGYGANITTPARRLNGTVVYPGQVFDFWSALGEVSLRTGYRMGGAIVDGHSVEGTALAGGICAASTTLFNAAVRAGYEIVARAPHWYYIARYPLGLDATVSGSQSMRFRNDTGTPLLIKGYASPGTVTFEVWGVPSGRTVTWSQPVVTNVVRGSDSTQDTSDLPKGATQRIEWPADGKDVRITRTVRDAAGNLIRRDTFVSHYHRMVGITLVGTGPATP